MAGGGAPRQARWRRRSWRAARLPGRRLKRAKGGEGGGLGCWWRAALKAGRGECASPSTRRVWRARRWSRRSAAWQARRDGREGQRGVQARHSWPGSTRRDGAASCGRPSAASSAVGRENRAGREEERERRVNRSLTQNDSNFCIETRKMVNIKVVRNSKSYNLRVGQNFIRAMG